MIISTIIGGLGNQMFQYATGYSLAKELKTTLRVDLSLLELFKSKHNGYELERVFGINTKQATRKELLAITGLASISPTARKILAKPLLKNIRKKTFLTEQQCPLPTTPPAYLYGYWQSESYFTHSENKIKTLFRFPKLTDKEDLKAREEITTRNSTSLHVRRGDYISNKKAAQTHGTCSIEYYKNAIHHFEDTHSDIHFFIFSDDSNWALENITPLAKNTTVIRGHTGPESYRDMQLMSLCKHHIIANSSFSWWGAWLNPSNEKIVIAPRAWFADGSTPPNLIPEKWLRI